MRLYTSRAYKRGAALDTRKRGRKISLLRNLCLFYRPSVSERPSPYILSYFNSPSSVFLEGPRAVARCIIYRRSPQIPAISFVESHILGKSIRTASSFHDSCVRNVPSQHILLTAAAAVDAHGPFFHHATTEK